MLAMVPKRRVAIANRLYTELNQSLREEGQFLGARKLIVKHSFLVRREAFNLRNPAVARF